MKKMGIVIRKEDSLMVSKFNADIFDRFNQTTTNSGAESNSDESTTHNRVDGWRFKNRHYASRTTVRMGLVYCVHQVEIYVLLM